MSKPNPISVEAKFWGYVVSRNGRVVASTSSYRAAVDFALALVKIVAVAMLLAGCVAETVSEPEKTECYIDATVCAPTTDPCSVVLVCDGICVTQGDAECLGQK